MRTVPKDKIEKIKETIRKLEKLQFYWTWLQKDLFILKKFVETWSYQETANIINKSKQRVEQLVRKYLDDNVIRKYDSKKCQPIS